MSLLAALTTQKYSSPQQAQRAIETRAGGRDNLLYVDWRTGMTADLRRVVLEDSIAYICFHTLERGRMVFALHATRPDGTAGRLVMRAEA